MARKVFNDLTSYDSKTYAGSLNEKEIQFLDLDVPQGIVKHDDGTLSVSSIRVHRTGLEFTGYVNEDEYEKFGLLLLKIDTAYQWVVGDYLAYGVENNYGMATKFAEQLDRDPATIHNWTSVCRQVEFSLRHENLSFTHHYHVAPLSRENQVFWLDLAHENKWGEKKLRKEIAKANGDIEETQKRNEFEVVMDSVKPVPKKRFKKLNRNEHDALIRKVQNMLADYIQWRDES